MTTKLYRLLGADGIAYESPAPGMLGGNSRLRIYGRLDCPSAVRALPLGYSKVRFFFADEPLPSVQMQETFECGR